MRAIRVLFGVFIAVALALGMPSLFTPLATAAEPVTVDIETDLPAKLALSLKTLALAEEKFGPEHQYTLLALIYLAQTYEQLAQYRVALPLQQRISSTTEKLLGPKNSATALVLGNLALTYDALAQYQQALTLQKRVLEIDEGVMGPEHLDTAKALNNLATTYQRLAQYEQALQLQRRALAIYEKNLGPEHADTATALGNLSAIYATLGQYQQALSLRLRALAIQEKSIGPNHLQTALALNNLASTYSDLAKYELVLPLRQRALAISEESLGAEHPNTANFLSQLAVTYSERAQYELALPLHQHVLAIREKVFGPEHPSTADALNNLAATFDDLGQYEKALPLKQRVLAIREKLLGPEHPDTADALHILAATYIHDERYDDAVPLLDRTLRIYVNVLGPEHPSVASAVRTLAYFYFHAGQYADALSFQLKALAIDEKSLGLEHPVTAVDLVELAFTYGALEQNELAIKLQFRALAIEEKILGRDHADTGSIWTSISLSLYKTGQREAAILAGKRAINVTQFMRSRVSKIGLSEAKSYADKYRYQYEILSSWLTEAGRISEAQQVLDMLKETEHFDFIRRASDNDPRKTRIGYTRSEQEWLPRYEQISSRLSTLGAEQQALEKKAKLGLSDDEKTRQKQLSVDLKVAQTAFTTYLNEMRIGFSKKGAARVAEVEESSEQSLKLMQGTLKAMDPGAVLVRYYMTDTQVKMLLTTPGVQLARDATITPKDLNSKIAAFNRALRDPKADPLPLAQELYTALVRPIAQDLQQAGAKTVMLYLDGALRYLPFSALHDGQQYLVERWRMPIYTAVAKDKLREAVTPQWTVAGMGVTRPWRDFAALPAVKQELSAIVKSTGFFQWASGGALPGELFLDDQFTAKSLKDVGQRPFSVLHIASHFRFSPGTEVNSALLLGDGQELTLGDIRTQGYSFKNVDLLTLSACETGLGGGRDERGREIEGFGVIAQQQGAKAVLATLWPVADQSTALLMQEMYRQRQEKSLTKAEALRQAQLTVMRQKPYAHPFYWAPFILMGNWL